MKPTQISFPEIVSHIPWDKIKSFSPEFIVGIERGGTVLAALIAFNLDAELFFLRASFYDNSKPAKKKHPQPIIQAKNSIKRLKQKRLLLVDDVSNTGQTLQEAKKFLLSKGVKQIKTFVYSGQADFSCRPFNHCLCFPWEIMD